MSWNPFKKDKTPHVWVHADPENPHAGIASISEDKPELRPVFKVTGITFAEARLRFVGKVLEWDRIHGLRNDEKEVPVDVFERWFR